MANGPKLANDRCHQVTASWDGLGKSISPWARAIPLSRLALPYGRASRRINSSPVRATSDVHSSQAIKSGPSQYGHAALIRMAIAGPDRRSDKVTDGSQPHSTEASFRDPVYSSAGNTGDLISPRRSVLRWSRRMSLTNSSSRGDGWASSSAIPRSVPWRHRPARSRRRQPKADHRDSRPQPDQPLVERGRAPVARARTRCDTRP